MAWRRRLTAIARLRRPSPRVRGVLLLVAGLGTIVAVILAVDRLSLDLAALRVGPLLLAALVVTPLTVLLNAAELRATALGSGADLARVGWGRSIRTVVLATAANLLPVPAGALLRVQVLVSAGATWLVASAVQVAAAGVWIGASITLAGGALLVDGTRWGAVALAAGVAGIAVGLVGVTRTATERPRRAVGWLAIVEVLTALVHVARSWVVLLGLGVDASVLQATVIAAASPIAAAAGFFPGGVGLAELISAVLAPTVGLAAAAALLAVAVGRLLGLLVTVPVALALGLGDLVRRAGPEAATTQDAGAGTQSRPEVEG